MHPAPSRLRTTDRAGAETREFGQTPPDDAELARLVMVFAARPHRDGFLVAPTPMPTGAPLFAVRNGRVGLAPSNQRPTLDEVWEMLGETVGET